MFWPCETRTSTCRNFATISSGLYRFLVITVLLDVKDIPQVGPLQWGRISSAALLGSTLGVLEQRCYDERPHPLPGTAAADGVGLDPVEAAEADTRGRREAEASHTEQPRGRVMSPR